MLAATTSSSRDALAQRVRGLYAVTPDTEDTGWLVRAVAAAIAGGAAVVQYRNKTASPALRHAQAAALRPVVAERGALFIVNDDAALAAEVGADGVHVGEEDGDIAAVRAIVGPHRLVGVSCYNEAARGARAGAAGADYIAFGSFFASAVKPGARRAELGLLGQAAALRMPIVAIGGITAENAGMLRAAGAHAVAVISAVFGPREPQAITAAARVIAAQFDRSASPERSKTHEP